MKNKSENRGGKREGAGRHPNPPELEAVTIAFRVLARKADEIKAILANLTVEQRTKILLELKPE